MAIVIKTYVTMQVILLQTPSVDSGIISQQASALQSEGTYLFFVCVYLL